MSEKIRELTYVVLAWLEKKVFLDGHISSYVL